MYIGVTERSGSVSHDQVGDGIGFGLEQLTETGAELAAEDSAADLGQEDLKGRSPRDPFGVMEPLYWLLHVHGYDVFGGRRRA